MSEMNPNTREASAASGDGRWPKLIEQLFNAAGKRTSVGISSFIEGDLSPAMICALCTEACAHLQSPVLLIEADWSRPSLAEYLGAPAAPGLGDLLASSTQQLFHCVHRTKLKHVWMMPSGSPPQMLNTRNLDNRCREVYDSLPPGIENIVITLSTIRKRSSLPIGCSMVDRFAFIVTPYSVAPRAIRSAARRLGVADAKVAGVIWADDSLSDSSLSA